MTQRYDDDGFPLPDRPPAREVGSLLERRGEARRREREQKLAQQRAAIDSLDVMPGGGLVYPDGQGRLATEQDVLDQPGGPNELVEDVLAPNHSVPVERWPE